MTSKPDRAPARRGPARSEAARVAILEATARLFAERGYEGLTMEGVAAEAGVGKQTIYRWWPAKSALLAECLAEGLIMPDWFAPPDSGDLRADLTVWLQNVVDFIGQPGNDALLRSLVAASAYDASVATGDIDELPVEDLMEAMLGAVVVRALRRGTVDRDFAARLVTALFGPRRR